MPHRRRAREAIIAPGSPAITFAALQALAAATRSRLAALGLGPRDRVAVVMPIGQAAAALTAAVASGVACLPLNPSYSARELRLAFVDLRVRAVVAGRECDQAAATAAELGLPVLVGEDLIAVRAGGDNDAPMPTADDIALLLHTSGTTARAKVVAISHRTLAGIARKLITWFTLQPQDRCLNLMPIYNAHGTEAALFPTLFSGGSLVCLPQFTTDAFFAALQEFAPSWYTGGFTFNQAIATAIDEAPERGAPCHLRFMRSGSGRLPAKARETLERAFKVPLIESYAMTEAGVITANPMPPNRRRPGTAGFPIAEDVAIVGEDGATLPAGKDGEIVIRGPLVATRYENDPDSSAKAFRNGWLHTGDQGHFDEDGYLVVTGRIKEMINRGGDKISPLEVDSVLIAHPDVKEAVTFAMPHPTLGEEVGAAVVLRAGAAVNADGLKRYAATQLAPFKVPRLIKAVDAIPKTPAGKVARIGMHERLGLSNAVARRAERAGGGAPQPDRGGADRPVDVAAQGGPHRHGRRFLPARRRLAAGDAARGLGARSLRRGAADAQPVRRGGDDRRHGEADRGRPRRAAGRHGACRGTGRCVAAAVVGAAAAVVPAQPRAGERRVQRAVGAASARLARPRSTRPRARRAWSSAITPCARASSRWTVSRGRWSTTRPARTGIPRPQRPPSVASREETVDRLALEQSRRRFDLSPQPAAAGLSRPVRGRGPRAHRHDAPHRLRPLVAGGVPG